MALKVGELFAEFKIDSSSLNSSLSQIEQTCNTVGSGMVSAGVGLSAAITAPIVKAAKDMYNAGTDFDAQMSKVFAIRGLDKELDSDVESMEALRAKAIEMGSKTEWTATQSGEAFQYMAMAGWQTEAMLAGLTPVMNLATAAGADLGTTSDIVTDAMTAFGLTFENAGNDIGEFNKDVQHFTDVIAAAATNSNTNVEMLGTSFKYVAPLAGSFGMSVDDVAVALGLMANSGIKSTTAGAALRNILTGLNGTTDKQVEACETLGVSLRNERGETKSMMEIMQDLRESYKDNQGEVELMAQRVSALDAQLADGTITTEEYEAELEDVTQYSGAFTKACVQLAGKQGLSGLLSIMRASDDEFDALVSAIDDCEGATDQMAATMRDNAKGAVTILKSAIEGLSITLWDLYKDKFTAIVEGATEMIQQFQALDSETQMTIMRFAGLAAAAGPVLIIGGKLVKSLPAIAKGIAALVSPTGIAIAGLALFAVAAVDADNVIGNMFKDTAIKAAENLRNFNSNILGNMDEISSRVGTLAESISEGLAELVPVAMETIMLVIEGFMKSIGENASSIAEIGRTIIGGIVTGISNALPTLIPTAVLMVAQLGAELIKNIPMFVSMVGQLLGSFIQGVSNVDWETIGSTIIGAVNESISGLTTILDSWLTEAGTYVGKQDWASVGTSIIDSILDTTISIATQIGNFIVHIADELSNYTGWETLGTQLGAVAQHLIEGIADAIPGLTDIVVKIIGAISGVLSGEGVESLTQGFENFAESIITGLVNAIPKVAEGAGNLITALANLLNDLPLENATSTFNYLATSIIGLIVTGIESASGLAETLFEAIASLFTEEGLATKLVTAAGQIATTLIDAIGNAIPDVAGAAVNIISKIGELLSGDSSEGFLKAAIEVAQDIITSIVNAIPQVASGAIDIITAIGKLFTGNGEEQTSLADAAISIAEALVKSITDAIPDTMDSIKGIATALIDNIVTVLPKLFESGGKIVSAGMRLASELVKSIGEGFNESEGMDIDFAGIVQSLVDGIADAVSNLPALVGDVLSVGAQIANSLMTALANALTDIESSGLGNVFGTTLANLVKGLFGAVTDFASNPDVKGFVENLGKGIVAALGTIGETLGTFVGELLKAIFSKEGLTKIFEAGKSIIELLIKGVEAGISGMFTFAFNILDGILEGLGILDPDVKAAYTEALRTAENYKSVVQEAFADGFYWDEGDIDIGNVNDAIMQALSLKMTGADFDLDMFNDLALSIKDKISNYLGYQISEDSAGYHFENIIDGVIDNLVRAANEARIDEASFTGLDVKGILGPFLDEFGAGAEAISPELYDTIADYLLNGGIEGENNLFAVLLAEILGDPGDESTQEIVDNAEASIDEIFNEICGSAVEAAGEAQVSIDGIEISWDSVFANSLANVSTWRTDLEAALTEMGVSAGSLLGVALPDGVAEGLAAGTLTVQAAADAIVAAAAATDEQIAAAKAENKSGGEDIGAGMSEGADSKTGDVEASVQGLVDAAEAPTGDLIETFSQTTTDAVNGMEVAMASELSNVEEAAAEVCDAAVQQFLVKMTSENGETIGKAYTDGLRQALIDARDSVVSAAQNIADDAKNILDSILSFQAGADIGLQIANGIAQGISNGASSVIYAAQVTAYYALKAMKDELGISSPSKVARDEIGKMYDLGLAKGLTDNVATVTKAAKDVSDSLHDSFYVGDVSRGTVQTARQSAITNGMATAQYLNISNQNQTQMSRDAIAEAIRSGMNGIIFVLNGEEVGNAVAPSVSRYIGEEALSRT